MIEMQWVKTEHTAKDDVRIADSYGTAYKLQFREVIQRYSDSSVEVATIWQDVEIGKATQ